jgi:hypothetical protein
MSFELEVEFRGLCLIVRDPGGEVAGVLMPDCRKTVNPLHEDGTMGVHHVGYLRLDLANLSPGGPRADVIHRFNCESLEFVGIEGEAMTTNVEEALPDFARFAADVELKPGLFSEKHPAELLMRTVLKGGDLSGDGLKTWFLPRHLKVDTEYSGTFASAPFWTRTVEGDYITLRIVPFDGSDPMEFTLRPVEGENVVSLKIANLCAINPLEWGELEGTEELEEPAPGYRDEDFKWLYRLLQSRTAPFGTRLGNEDFPVPVHSKREDVAGVQGCMPGTITAAVPTD